jgi:hypothetical protein
MYTSLVHNFSCVQIISQGRRVMSCRACFVVNLLPYKRGRPPPHALRHRLPFAAIKVCFGKCMDHLSVLYLVSKVFYWSKPKNLSRSQQHSTNYRGAVQTRNSSPCTVICTQHRSISAGSHTQFVYVC